MKRTNSDLAYCQFTLAVNRQFKDKNGEKQADFINCVAWRNSAELLSKYVHKGNQIGVEGQIQTRNYQDGNGVKHFITEVLAEQIYFLEPKGSQEQPINNYQPPVNQENKAPQDFMNTKDKQQVEDIGDQFGITNDDLPF